LKEPANPRAEVANFSEKFNKTFSGRQLRQAVELHVNRFVALQPPDADANPRIFYCI